MRRRKKKHRFDAWHSELLRLGFKWRKGLKGELAPDGRKVERFYWRYEN